MVTSIIGRGNRVDPGLEDEHYDPLRGDMSIKLTSFFLRKRFKGLLLISVSTQLQKPELSMVDARDAKPCCAARPLGSM